MARLILKSPYIKCGGLGRAGGYMSYVATRDGVELLPQPELFAQYMATRPGARHGLFGDEDHVELAKAMGELEHFTGKVWTHVLSLKREDAARLGYDHAEAWRDLLKARRNEIAAAMRIQPEQFRWYAAFHDEGDHPHVHMMAWSARPGREYLSKDGIRQIKSVLANDIFKQEMLHTCEQTSAARDELVRETRRRAEELSRQMRGGVCDCPEAGQLLLELSKRLETVAGRKQYGYLSKSVKAMVNRVVDALERAPEVESCYQSWWEMRQQMFSFYTDKRTERPRLSQEETFRAVKNAVVQSALHLGEPTFEDERVELLDELDEEGGDRLWAVRETLWRRPDTLDQWEQAVAELDALCRAGDFAARYEMGKLYRDGGAVLPDATRAKQWLRLAAEGGCVPAQYALGKLCLSDDREARDVAEGLHSLELAAENGSPWAGYRLGKEYLTGKNVPVDRERAEAYLQRAAEQGNQFAQYTLGKLCLTGGDRGAARDWFNRAADQGNPCANYFLTHLQSPTPPSALLAITGIVAALGELFEDSLPPEEEPVGMRMDRKLWRKIQEKKQAMGLKDGPEPYQGMRMM